MKCGKHIGKTFLLNMPFIILTSSLRRSETAWKKPACIYSPNNVDDVINAISTLRNTGTQFAIRGGGHSPIPTWANIDGGVLISMSRIADLSYDARTETARIGSGNTWGQVYKFLESFQRVVVAGRAPTVGFGLLAGGKFKVRLAK
jgi:FAD/FMN-containing dehydrogenase